MTRGSARRLASGLALGLLAGAGAGCGIVRRVDPCAEAVAACVALHVEPGGDIVRADRFTFRVDGDGYDFSRTVDPGRVHELPVAIALLFGDLGSAP